MKLSLQTKHGSAFLLRWFERKPKQEPQLYCLFLFDTDPHGLLLLRHAFPSLKSMPMPPTLGVTLTSCYSSSALAAAPASPCAWTGALRGGSAMVCLIIRLACSLGRVGLKLDPWSLEEGELRKQGTLMLGTFQIWMRRRIGSNAVGSDPPPPPNKARLAGQDSQHLSSTIKNRYESCLPTLQRIL